MKSNIPDSVVTFYFELDEQQQWAVRESFRYAGNDDFATDLLNIDHHYRRKNELAVFGEKVGVDFITSELDKAEEKYSGLIRYNALTAKVETIPYRERLKI